MNAVAMRLTFAALTHEDILSAPSKQRRAMAHATQLQHSHDPAPSGNAE